MKRSMMALALLLGLPAAALAQGFQANVPGVGPVSATVGFSPAPLDSECEVQSTFPPGQKLTTPFTVYIIVRERARSPPHFTANSGKGCLMDGTC